MYIFPQKALSFKANSNQYYVLASNVTNTLHMYTELCIHSFFNNISSFG